MTEEDLALDMKDIPLPPIPVQRVLLELYWTYVQPVMPVLDRGRFMEEWENESVEFPFFSISLRCPPLCRLGISTNTHFPAAPYTTPITATAPKPDPLRSPQK